MTSNKNKEEEEEEGEGKKEGREENSVSRIISKI